jgi:hypothetical protein
MLMLDIKIFGRMGQRKRIMIREERLIGAKIGKDI